MSRLIDADKLLEPVGSYDPKKYTQEYGMVVTVEDIKNAPTVDAEPVKHGKWVTVDKDLSVYQCSECRDIRQIDDIPIFAYCPRCGARMDGEYYVNNILA